MVKATTEKDEAGTISVEVCVLGSEIKTVCLEEGATVEMAVTAAGFDTSRTVKCSGEVVALEDQVEDGDRLIITDKVKGG